MEVVETKNLKEGEVEAFLKRPPSSSSAALKSSVSQVIEQVKGKGDEALRELTYAFDGVDMKDFRVPPKALAEARGRLSTAQAEAIDRAFEQIKAFHEKQRPLPYVVEHTPGVRCELRYVPIQRVGLYIPGGSAPLPSTVLMVGVPSLLAKNPTKILVSPPQAGGLHPAILYAAALCEIESVYQLGGAQAIAALAYGTESVPKVDKIFGPGNAYVTEAKQQVALDPAGAAMDMPAGPSEVMVVADASGCAAFIAADLLSQAEHGPDSQAILLSLCPELTAAVKQELSRQLARCARKEVAEKALAHSRLITCAHEAEALSLVEAYAPEHLIIQTKDPEHFAAQVTQAGSLFLGPYTPESMGDYASGTNHVLPTYGYARSYSGLSLSSFMRHMSVQTVSREGLAQLGPLVMELSAMEGLDAHREAVRVRLQEEQGR